MSHSFETIKALASLTKDSFSARALNAINRVHKLHIKDKS